MKRDRRNDPEIQGAGQITEIVRLNDAAFEAFSSTCESAAPTNENVQRVLRRRNAWRSSNDRRTR